MKRRDRGQANLIAVGVALLALTAVLGVALAVADGALAGADRDAPEQRLAVSLSNRLVAADGPFSTRANVLDSVAIEALNETTLGERLPVAAGHDVEIRLDDRLLASSGDATGGATVRRIVLVERETTESVTPTFAAGRAVTLPRRTDRVVVDLQPRPGTSITTVRANGRVVLHDPAGLSGRIAVQTSRFETTRLSFDSTGTLAAGDVEVTYFPTSTTKAMLVVTVDRRGDGR
ncbi:DUF7263 family protein [Haloarchaeobius sp. TZWWS8]|uniref:DUF7263 family protein n=1 Tax=Haloarchaeobius sp. TZWWS8 TaxID=3446121 RepID=UPI003EBCF3FC